MKGLRKELPRCLPGIDPEQKRAIFEHVRTRTPVIVELDESWTVNVPSRQHLEWASSMLAAFEAVRPHLSDEAEAVDFVARVNRAGVSFHLAGIFANLLCRPKRDAQTMIRRLFKLFLPQYGSPWHWRLRESASGDHAIEIKHCFYHEFMSIHGHPRLTRAVCDLHLIWIDRMNGSRHGMSFDRSAYTTMERGDELCRLPFIKVTTSAGTRPGGPTQ